MLIRLANVVYYGAIIINVIFFFYMIGQSPNWASVLSIAGTFYAFAWVIRYILTGNKAFK